jgi:hypothetical protein
MSDSTIKGQALRNIFIFGIDSWLGSSFAAQCLQLENDRVFYAADQVQEEAAVEWCYAASAKIKDKKSAINSLAETARLLHPLRLGFDVTAAVAAADCDLAEVWVFADAASCADGQDSLKKLISSWPARSVGQVNYVRTYTPFPCNSREAKASYGVPGPAETVLELCRAQNISCRIFETALIVGDGVQLRSHGIFSEFLRELHAFKLEIEERSPQYFDFHALRCFAPKDAALNLMSADAASELLLRVSARTYPKATLAGLAARNIPRCHLFVSASALPTTSVSCLWKTPPA